MAFGTADRLKSDVAEGVALVIGRLAVRRAGRVGLLTTGAPTAKQLPPRGGRAQLVALQRALGAGVAPDGYVPPEDALAEGHATDRSPRPWTRADRRRLRLPRGERW